MTRNLIFPAMLLAGTHPVAAQIIGSESFTYADGPIAGATGGTGWNYDNFDKVITATTSNWNATAGSPTVISNALTTTNGGAKREYNGPTEGSGGTDGDDNGERSGAVRGTGIVFYKFTFTRGAGVSWSGASSYDFGTERMFFGVTGTVSPRGVLEFSCTGNGNTYFTGIPADNNTHTVVTVLDFDNDFIGMWLDPTATDFYDPTNGAHSTDAGGAYTPTNWSTSVRLASSAGGITTWDDLMVALDPVSVGLRNYADVDNDGLPDSWETRYNLDPADDGSNGETTPGAKNGPNGALGDPDGDGVGNLVEFQDGTLPNNDDTDADGLKEGQEKTAGTNPLNTDTDADALTDGAEVNLHNSSPLLGDTDSGGTADFTEIALATQTGNAADDRRTNGNLALIGQEYFDTYPDGPIGGLNGGSGWDYDNSALGETFTGHTTLKSAWNNIGATPEIQAGRLLTQASSVKRPFHGGSASPTAFMGEKTGAWRENAAATGVNGSNVLYAKVTISRQNGAEWSGMSLYDFGTERIFLGVPSGLNPASGVREFGIQQSSTGTVAFSGIAPATGTAYTIVGRYDFAASRVDLWVNPDTTAAESASPIIASLTVLPAQMNATGIRLGSGGTGTTSWDQLVVGTTWSSLNSAPSDSDGDGLPDDYEDLYGFNKNLNDAAQDQDADGNSNLAEYQAGTNPTKNDSDNDGLSDGTGELAAGTNPLIPDTDGDGLLDGEEVNTYRTNPLVVDSDADGQSDGGEVQGDGVLTSDPLDAADTVGAPLGLLGSETFDYSDGPVSGLSGGRYFDYENWLFNGPFVGHTGSFSDWDGTAVIENGKLTTLETNAWREFNGPTEGAGTDAAPTDARAGAVNQDINFKTAVVYIKATLTRRSGAVLSVFGPDDFNAERVAFGIVDNAGIPQWGIREGAAVTTDNGSLPVADNQTYTVIGKLDFRGDRLSFWVNPDQSQNEAANPALVTRTYTGTNWASGIRFASTGTGATEWDNITVAHTWEQLAAPAPLPIQLSVASFNSDTGTLSLTATGIPAGTFHLRQSTDLQNFIPLDPPITFDANTPQPFVIPVAPGTQPRYFLRAQEGASPP